VRVEAPPSDPLRKLLEQAFGTRARHVPATHASYHQDLPPTAAERMEAMGNRVARRGVGMLVVGGVCLCVVAQAGGSLQERDWREEASVPMLLGGARGAVEVDRAVAAALRRTGVTAAAVAVVRGSGPLYTTNAGIRVGAGAVPVDDRTVFRAASLGKAVFAYLVFTLVDDGLMELDRPLHEYLARPLPEYPDYADLAGDTRYRAITARLALSHRTGFPNWRWQMKDRRLRILFDPGERFLYSGEGYRYLQFVIEQITGKDLDTLARARVFEPLGMTTAGYAWRDAQAANSAVDRAPIEAVFGPGFLSRPNAAGSLLTSVADYGRFLTAVLGGGRLARRWQREMFAPQTVVAGPRLFGPPAPVGAGDDPASRPFWCLGWAGFHSNAGPVRFHVGYDSPEYENYAVIYLEKDLGLVVLTSGGRGPAAAVPVFVEAVLGSTDTPFGWMGYGQP
jgi:CubicO group peptidase (beta-lactamase class C family)